jgi:tetratricopeptide (TPR) repeat protein
MLLQFVESSPTDAFVRYGLAQEYVNRGQLEKAIEEFNTLLANNAEYQAAYYHAGQTYLKLGRKEEARDSFQKGIEVATRSGDMHARSELEAALDEL